MIPVLTVNPSMTFLWLLTSFISDTGCLLFGKAFGKR